MTAQTPPSVRRAIWLLRAVMVWLGLTALFTYLFLDELIETWAEGNETARAILRERGLQALKDSSINIPKFVPVAVVMFVVFAALTGVLVVFLRSGHGWARNAITAMVLFMGFATLAGLDRDLPPLFVGLSVIALVLSLALLVLLWHKDTSAYLRAPYVPTS
jgi:hypothetical protein